MRKQEYVAISTFLIEVLLPPKDNKNRRLPDAVFRHVQETFTRKFGGFTAFDRTPASGMNEQGGLRHRDEIVIYEVLALSLEREWWSNYRVQLETEFQQDEVVIPAFAMERL
jgi:hypothetical protein